MILSFSFEGTGFTLLIEIAACLSKIKLIISLFQERL
jgi:hypothetical protein